MPSSKKIRPPPSFSFVTTRLEADGVSWLKIHSGATRSHAAYWGGPLNNNHHDNKTRPPSPQHIRCDNLEYLPFIPSEIRAADSAFSTALLIFEFFGDGFMKHFAMSNHEDYPIMFSGCLLLSYANSMALTGRGTKTLLLQLKVQVIRLISTKMRSSDGSLSPQCLTAILALGAPIVCLVSQDLPKSLIISEYIKVSTQEDFLCCSASADTAKHALEERIIHRRAMRKLFSKSTASSGKADKLAQYISNSMNMYASFKHPCQLTSI